MQQQLQVVVVVLQALCGMLDPVQVGVYRERMAFLSSCLLFSD